MFINAYGNQIIYGKKWVENEIHRQAKAAICAWRYHSTHGVYLLTVKYGEKRVREGFSEEQLSDCAGTKGVREYLKKQVSNIIKAFGCPEQRYERYLFVSERLAVKSFVKKARVFLGDSLFDLRMFGSKIAGVSDLDSDIDVLLVIGSEDWRVRDSISGMAAEINMEYGCNISPVIYTKTEYDKNRHFNTLFVQEVEKRGVPLG